MKKKGQMFLHLGADYMIYLEDVIAIVSARPSGDNPLRDLKTPLKVISVSKHAPKSFVVTSKAVYKSPISPATLFKRARSRKLVFEKPEKRGRWAVKKAQVPAEKPAPS